MVFDGTLSGNANRLKVFVNDELITLSFGGTIPATTVDLSTKDAKLGYSSNSFDGKIKWFLLFRKMNVITNRMVKDKLVEIYEKNRDYRGMS